MRPVTYKQVSVLLSPVIPQVAVSPLPFPVQPSEVVPKTPNFRRSQGQLLQLHKAPAKQGGPVRMGETASGTRGQKADS